MISVLKLTFVLTRKHVVKKKKKKKTLDFPVFSRAVRTAPCSELILAKGSYYLLLVGFCRGLIR